MSSEVKCVCLVNRFYASISSKVFTLASLAKASKEEFFIPNNSVQSLRNETGCIPIILGTRHRNVSLFIFVLGFKTKLLSLLLF